MALPDIRERIVGALVLTSTVLAVALYVFVGAAAAPFVRASVGIAVVGATYLLYKWGQRQEDGDGPGGSDGERSRREREMRAEAGGYGGSGGGG